MSSSVDSCHLSRLSPPAIRMSAVMLVLYDFVPLVGGTVGTWYPSAYSTYEYGTVQYP